MKVFAVVILVMVLGLSLVPCCTPITAIADNSLKISSGSCCSEGKNDCSKGADEEEDKGCVACSPFFSCGSCIGFTFQSINYHFKITQPYTRSSFLIHDIQVNSEYFNKMWQPPKIG